MKAKLFHLIPSLFLCIVSLSCISVNPNASTSDYGPMVKQTRQSTNITSIDASRGVQIIYTQSDQISVEVEAPQEVIDMIITKISDGELTATVDKKIRNINFRAIVRVSAPSVCDFEMSSGSSIETDGLNLPAANVELDVSSGASGSFANITASVLSVETSSGSSCSISGVVAESVVAESSSGASLSISGKATNAEFDASSGASLNASGLVVQVARAEASTGSSLTCNAKSFTKFKSTTGASISNNN